MSEPYFEIHARWTPDRGWEIRYAWNLTDLDLADPCQPQALMVSAYPDLEAFYVTTAYNGHEPRTERFIS